MSLLELLIGLGILSISVAVAATLMHTSSMATVRLESIQEQILLAQDVQRASTSSVSCTAAIGAAQTFDAAAANQPSGSPVTFSPGSGLNLVSGQPVGNFRLTTSAVFLSGAFVDSVQAGITTYLTRLTARFGGGRPRTLAPLRITVDASGKILTCEGVPPISSAALRTICESFYGTWSEATGKCSTTGAPPP